MANKITQREWDRAVGYGAPPDDQLIPGLPEYELDKSTGEVRKISKPEPEINIKRTY